MSRKIAGLFRAMLALLFCVAAIGAFFEMAAYYNWGNFQLRAPIFLLVPWAYALKPQPKLVGSLAGVAFICVVGPFLATVFPSPLLEVPPELRHGLAALGFGSLGLALTVHAVSVIRTWRSDRARLRAKSRGALERLTGGF